VLVVFTGPSLHAEAVRCALPWAQAHPPACRGDVEAAVVQGASTILLLDGGFAHRLAVSPGEIVAALRAGVRVIGAASLGAIRAAECHPAGMEGVGAVQRLYRVGVLRDDDEVAVATEPDHGHRAVSLALVNVRFAVLGGLRAGWLDRDRAAALLTAARERHFSERHWPAVFRDAGVRPSLELRALCLGYDVKRRDAERAVALLGQAPAAPRRVAAPQSPSAVRYPGHDPYFGWAPDVLAHELTEWLGASGRYRRYWPAPLDPETTWSELGERRERDHELMRWHAVGRGVELAGNDVGDGELGAARAHVAHAHGYSDWPALCAASAMGCLPCGVSVSQVSDAARQLARAARGLGVRA
jgi:hypothetical protein